MRPLNPKSRAVPGTHHIDKSFVLHRARGDRRFAKVHGGIDCRDQLALQIFLAIQKFVSHCVEGSHFLNPTTHTHGFVSHPKPRFLLIESQSPEKS